MPRIMTEDGRAIEMTIAQSQEAVKLTPLEIDARYRDSAAESRGRPAQRIGQKEQRAILYRGETPSLVPMSQVPFLLKQGFTPEPTMAKTPLLHACGIQMFDGTPCEKMLRTERDRVNHIRTAHGDVAPWVLSDIDIARARGKVILNQPTGSAEDPRVAVLEAQVAELMSLLKRSGSPVADEIASDLQTQLQVAEAGADEFMEEDNVPVSTEPTFSIPVPEVTDVKMPPPNEPFHTCRPKGRFGKIIDGCPACELKKLEMTKNGN